MSAIQELELLAKDLEFGTDELKIVQESYSALEKSYGILRNTNNPSHQAVQLHRIHVQSLADRLGVQMNSVAVEDFSPKTMHAFALEESEGFFAKIGKAIAAIFKWIKDAIVGIFNWITGRMSKEKTQAIVAIVKEASDVLVAGEIKPEKDKALLELTVESKKGGQVSDTKTLPFFNEITREYMTDMGSFIDIFFKLSGLANSLYGRLSDNTNTKYPYNKRFDNRLTSDKSKEYDDDSYMSHAIYMDSWRLMDYVFDPETIHGLAKYHKIECVTLTEEEQDNFEFSKLHATIGTNEYFEKSTVEMGKPFKLDKTALKKYGQNYALFMEESGDMFKKRRKEWVGQIDELSKHIETYIKSQEGESEAAKKYNRESLSIYRKMVGVLNSLTQAFISFFGKIMRYHNYVEKICKRIIEVSNTAPAVST